MELRRLGIAIAALLLWLPASSEAACSDHNGKGCGACAGLFTTKSTASLVFMQVAFFFHAYEILMVNEFHGDSELQFNPSHSSLNGHSALISGDTWLANVGMDIYSSPNMLLRDTLILAVACLSFWVGGYVSLRTQRYLR